MRQFKYVTNRTLRNKAEEDKGRIKVLVPLDSDTAQVDYICPECGHSEHTEQEWIRPFIVKCSNCSISMKIPKLKEEIKKEKDREKRKAKLLEKKNAKQNQ
ncbi:MAG: hypothetical protein JW789_02015 [Candidatus Aenigmarchaeota archaeon]|nr:hypothetical protein [Candidatus Aenigmarchaeota archaeon]